jgi:hypothetical protein
MPAMVDSMNQKSIVSHIKTFVHCERTDALPTVPMTVDRDIQKFTEVSLCASSCGKYGTDRSTSVL